MAGLYKLGHILRDNFSFLWYCVERVNSCMFFLRYSGRLKKIQNNSFYDKVLNKKENEHSVYIKTVSIEDVYTLSCFFESQPASAFTFFRPHEFDAKSLKSLVKDSSFLMWIAVKKNINDADETVGYIFQRSYFWGISYRGYITDYKYRGCGIGKLMMTAANLASRELKLKVYGSISPENKSSIKLAEATGGIDIIKTLDNGDYFVSYKID